MIKIVKKILAAGMMLAVLQTALFGINYNSLSIMPEHPVAGEPVSAVINYDDMGGCDSFDATISKDANHFTVTVFDTTPTELEYDCPDIITPNLTKTFPLVDALPQGNYNAELLNSDTNASLAVIPFAVTAAVSSYDVPFSPLFAVLLALVNVLLGGFFLFNRKKRIALKTR